MENFRKHGPSIRTIQDVNFPSYEGSKLDNGLPIYTISAGTQDIIKIELVFQSGRFHELKKVASRACNSQIKEGTLSLSSKKISDQIDYYGSTLRTGENLDTCSISLFCLGKYFDRMLPILEDIIKNPIFPEDELRKYKSNNIERLKVELTKNDVIAYRAITEQIFSDTHPYGYNSQMSDYDAVVREDLLTHYENNYGYNNCMIFLSGKVDESHIKRCNDYFGKDFRTAKPNEIIPKSFTQPAQKIKIKSEKDVQTAIKIGMKLFPRNHEDYAGMYFLNSVLGGYFGSRLMSNIREEKGYTYNIYSEVDVMKHDGLFMIGTEVSDEFAENTQEEIFKEINTLRTELIKEDEMKMVRNYLLGRILNYIDGPFNSSGLLKSILLSNLGDDYFEKLIDTIKNIQSSELRDLANKHLRPEDMWVITVGGKV